MKRTFTTILMLVAMVAGTLPAAAQFKDAETLKAETLKATADDLSAATQKAFKLSDCMKYAVENSPAVNKQKYTNDSYRATRDESFASMLPSVQGNSQATTSYGRNIDPETNTYTNYATFGNSYNLYTQMLAFHGLSMVNAYRSSRIGVLMGKSQLEQAKDQVALETMQAFFDLVFYTEAVEIARKQCEASRSTFERDSTMGAIGTKNPADVLQTEATMRSDEYTLVKQENARDLALLTLKQKMNYPSDKDLMIDTDITDDDPYIDPSLSELPSITEIMNYSLEHNPKVKSADYDYRKSRLEYASAKGKLFPSLYIGAGLNSAYYQLLGSTTAVTPYVDQLKNNFGRYWYAQLNFPIFNGLTYQSAAHRARNSMKIAEQTDIETRRALENEIETNYGQMVGFQKEFLQTLKKAQAAETAYNAEVEKYNQGVSSPIELQTAAGLMLQARSENLNARLQYLIKYRLVQYYAGQPLVR